MTGTPAAPPASSVPQVQPGTWLDANVPTGDPRTAWDRRKESFPLVSPGNRRRFTVVVVGTGLAGGAAAATLGELGYNVHAVTYHDAPRRAHSVAAQGGINAASELNVDGDSLERFVKDTVRGGDFRGREAEAYRLAQESFRVINHLNAIGAPFAREYGGTLSTRSFGGVQVSRTYYSRGQTGQQLQIATVGALQRQVQAGTVTMHTRTEMLDVVVEDGRARGVIVRNLVTGDVKFLPAHAVILATGGYGSVYYQSTLAVNCNATAIWRAHRRGALLANPSFVQFHPTAIPVNSPRQSKTVLMSESLRNDGRIWVPTKAGDSRPPSQIPEGERDYYLERKYPTYGNLTPRDVASRAATEQIQEGKGVGPLSNSVYLDFAQARQRVGQTVLDQRYGNLFRMYRESTGEDPSKVPMRIAPGAHFTMGGLWSDFNLMTTIPGLFVGGEAGAGYHGANRLGANSLLSAAVDGWFTLPLTVPAYLADYLGEALLGEDAAAVRNTRGDVERRTQQLLQVGGDVGPTVFHRQLGEILYQGCGVSRSLAGLEEAQQRIRELKDRFWQELSVPGGQHGINQTLEKAGRVRDFLDLAELMCVDALDREESCGAHFRVEHQREGEAQRDDSRWQFASVWGRRDSAGSFVRHGERLTYQTVPVTVRSYQ